MRAGSWPQGLNLGHFSGRVSVSSVNELRRRNALWKLTVLWKNQRTVFPQNLEPSVHSSHNAGCCWSFLRHNFSSTPKPTGGKSGGCALKAVELTSGDLRQVTES